MNASIKMFHQQFPLLYLKWEEVQPHEDTNLIQLFPILLGDLLSDSLVIKLIISPTKSDLGANQSTTSL